MEKHLIAQFDTYAREPILRRMKDGTLICLFLTGGPREPDNTNVIMIAKSRDDGVTWSEPETVFSHSSRGCWSTEVFTETEKPFAVVQTYNAPCHYRELQTYRSFCDDSGDVWSEPVTIPGSINGCSVRQGIVMSNGEILFPVYWQESVTKFDWDHNEYAFDYVNWPATCGVAISSDGGETFWRYGYIKAGKNPLWEPNAIELEPGHIIMYCRCTWTGKLYVSESFDYGRTWTEAVDSGIPSTDTKVTLCKANGTILLINNYGDGKDIVARKNLTIAKSKDGKNFETITTVEDPEEVWFYPHAYVDEEKKTLYLAYENAKQHWLKKYTFEELGI